MFKAQWATKKDATRSGSCFVRLTDGSEHYASECIVSPVNGQREFLVEGYWITERDVIAVQWIVNTNRKVA